MCRLPRAEAVFCRGGHVAVVVQHDGDPQPLGQIVPHGEVPDVHHGGGHAHIPLLEEDKGGHAYADSRQVGQSEAVFFQNGVDGVDYHAAEGGAVGLDGGGLLKAVQQAVLLVKQAVGHLSASGVDADAIGAHSALSSSA